MKETESIQTVDTNIKIPFWKAACFGLGDFGNNFVWTFVGSYLMIFYTDVFGIPMAAVSLLMLIARLSEVCPTAPGPAGAATGLGCC